MTYDLSSAHKQFMFLQPALRSLAFASSRSLASTCNSLKVAGPSTSLLTRSYSLTATKMAQEFKLKDIPSLDLKDGDKVEAQVEGIEGGKVLLVKVNNQVHALNANCTHFGAPLKNGVLTSDGRLTCPWHGGKQFEL